MGKKKVLQILSQNESKGPGVQLSGGVLAFLTQGHRFKSHHWWEKSHMCTLVGAHPHPGFL